MNVKAVVKVMNFHALLRVDASRRQAERYSAMEEELQAMMRIVLLNRNFRLDKKVQLPDPNLPVLRIFLGSDFGFCGGVNASVSSVLGKDSNSEQIIVGKKLRKSPNASLVITQEAFQNEFEQIQVYLERAVRERCWSGVELVYNHFYNLSSIKQITKRIYPLEALSEEQSITSNDDFLVEGNATKLLDEMTISYLIYEMRIAAASAFASENITRQNATTESMKKLDELEVEAVRKDRKEKNQKTFQKTIDSFVKQKSLQNAEKS